MQLSYDAIKVIKRFHASLPIKVALCLLLIQVFLPGLVQCFAADDHLAVEASHLPFHDPNARRQVPCLDVPLVSVSLTETPSGTSSGLFWHYLGFTPVASSMPLSPLFTVWPSIVLSHAQPSAYPPSSTIRSIVLRI